MALAQGPVLLWGPVPVSPQPLFIYLFMAVLGLRFCARAFSSCGKRGPLLIAVRGPLTIAASLVAEHRLQTRRLSHCGSRTQLPRGMWDLPRPGLKPASPVSAGRFSTTAPPGKPSPQPLILHLQSGVSSQVVATWNQARAELGEPLGQLPGSRGPGRDHRAGVGRGGGRGPALPRAVSWAGRVSALGRPGWSYLKLTLGINSFE